MSSLPSLRGSALDRVEWSFPEDLEVPTLLLVAFRQAQQSEVNTWLPVARRVAGTRDDFAYFEIPFIDRKWRPARGFIDGGMRAGLADAQVRASTVTVYGRRDPWLRRIGIDSMDEIVVLLVDPAGTIVWSARGSSYPEAEADLRLHLDQLSAR